MRQKLVKLKRKRLIVIIVISILLLKSLITFAVETDINDFVEKTDFSDKLKNFKNSYFKQNKTCRGWKETKWSNKYSNTVAQISERGYDF